MKSLRRSTQVDTYGAPFCVGQAIARGKKNSIEKEEGSQSKEAPHATTVNGFSEQKALKGTAIQERIAGGGDYCDKNYADLAHELAIDMGQVVATPQMLVSAVNCLRTEIKNGIANLAAICAQSEKCTQDTRLYTRDEVAKRLGVGMTTLDSMRQDPDFPCIYLTDASNRGSVRFDMDEVLSHIHRKNAIRRELAK